MEVNQGYVYFLNFTLALFMLNDRKLGEPIKWIKNNDNNNSNNK